MMRYFSDQQLAEMRARVNAEMDTPSKNIFLTYINRIETLDKLNAQDNSHRAELMQVLADFQRFDNTYVPHKEKIDINDEDADAYEYENYDYQQAD